MAGHRPLNITHVTKSLMSFFKSTYPIMCALMNGASDISLAKAVARAGATPSLMLWIRDAHGNKNYELLDRTLDEFKTATGHCDLVLGLIFDDLLDYNMIKLINDYQVGYVEFLSDLVPPEEIMNDPKATILMKKTKKTTKILCRVLDHNQMYWFADAYCAKGSDGAGFGGELTVEQMFVKQKNFTPDIPVIPYGGIGLAEHVKHYIDLGAPGVAAGTLFAASQESCVSTQTKAAMIKATSEDLYRFPDTGQRALILGSVSEINKDTRHWNKLDSLKAGIYGNGTQGLIYAGQSIDHVTKIRTVEDIVKDLVKLL